MNDFEFMRDLTIGQYIPGRSIIHRLDPRARILGAVIFMLALTFSQRPEGLALGLAAALLFWLLARLSLRPVLKGWRAALPFLLILALLQVFFHIGPQGGAVVFHIFSKPVTTLDLLAGVDLIVRFMAFIAVLALASSVLSSSDITRGLSALLRPLARLRLPVDDFVMVVQVTLRFFPLLAQTAERIAKAQASRGADWNARGSLVQRVRQRLPLLVPLFVTSLRRAEQLALAMDARAYGSGIKRTSMVALDFRAGDWLALLIVTGLAAAVML